MDAGGNTVTKDEGKAEAFDFFSPQSLTARVAVLWVASQRW